MKHSIRIPFIYIILLSAVHISLPSCKKEVIRNQIKTDTVKLTVIQKDTIIVRDTVIRKDTVVIKDTAFSIAILTAHPWRMQESKGIVGVNSVETFFYVRNSTSNTVNYDADKIVFRTNKTGTYTDPNNASQDFTWDFVDASQTQLTFILSTQAGIQVITWENIVYKDGKIKYAKLIKGPGDWRTHSYDIRIR